MKWYWWLLIAIILVVLGIFAYNKYSKKDNFPLTDEQMREILLQGNIHSGMEIESMTREQLIKALQSGGYLLHKV